MSIDGRYKSGLNIAYYIVSRYKKLPFCGSFGYWLYESCQWLIDNVVRWSRGLDPVGTIDLLDQLGADWYNWAMSVKRADELKYEDIPGLLLAGALIKINPENRSLISQRSSFEERDLSAAERLIEGLKCEHRSVELECKRRMNSAETEEGDSSGSCR